ncbi:MAG: cob(I)yrinic acid a,c-diamide adenosyltransferase [Acutalibacteraceae bacterium]
MLHIYYGNGKGKTSCATGIAVRAAGRNHKVLFVQFLKCEDTGERFVLRQMPNITLSPLPENLKFVKDMNEEEKRDVLNFCRKTFDDATKQTLIGKYDMVIFDEIFTAIENKLLTDNDLFEFLANAPKNIEIILTGHNPIKKHLDLADYVTEMKKIKHPYEKGVGPRKGIEY